MTSDRRIGRNGVAADRMIVAYSRSDGAATNYEIAWVTVALRHLRAEDDSWIWIDRVHRWLQTYGLAGAARARGRPGVPARLSELSLVAGQGAPDSCLFECSDQVRR